MRINIFNKIKLNCFFIQLTNLMRIDMTKENCQFSKILFKLIFLNILNFIFKGNLIFIFQYHFAYFAYFKALI